MPFLTRSCWGHSAHMVKVDEIFKVTEIYKVTLAGHPAWIFFLLEYETAESESTLFTDCRRGMQSCCIRNCSRTKTEPKLFRALEKMTEGEDRNNYPLLPIKRLITALTLHPFFPTSKEREALIKKDSTSPSVCCMPLDVGTCCSE